MLRVLRWVGLVVVVAGLTAAAFLLGRGKSSGDTAESPDIRLGEATVVRTDLVTTETLRGSLRFSDRRVVYGGLGGTVTSLPEEDSRIAAGAVLYQVDGEPVVVFDGNRPAWRPFVRGMSDGADVAQLEQNLADLGYLDQEPDEDFDRDTERAIEAWRDDAGLDSRNSIESGRIVFTPVPVRVAGLRVEVGQPLTPGTPVMAISSTSQEVVIQLNPNDLDVVEEGDPVTVTLPDDSTVGGRVNSVGRVVSESTGPGGSDRFVEVRVSLRGTVEGIDSSPVDVEIESARVSDVLAVPVSALLSLSDGGYAVEVIRDGGETELVGVETGEFAGGLVEVTGAVSEGDRVVVPG